MVTVVSNKKSNVTGIGGYEVIRDGQMYSTTEVKKGDLVVKPVFVSGGGGGNSGGGGQSISPPAPVVMPQTQGEQQAMQRVEQQKQLSPVDIHNLRRLAERSNIRSSGGGAGIKQIDNYLNVRQNILARQEQQRQKDSFYELQKKQEERFKNYLKTEKANNIKESFIDKIKKIGTVGSQRRKQILKSKIFDKELNSIYNDLNKVQSKYTIGNTNEVNPYNQQYQKELAGIVNRYNKFSSEKEKYSKTLKDKYTQASIEYNPVLGENVLTLSPKDRRLSSNISKAINDLTTKTQRKGESIKTTSKLGALVAGGAVLSTVQGFLQTPQAVAQIVKNPSSVKNIPSAIKKSGVSVGKLLRVSPTVGLVKIGTELYLFNVGGKYARMTGRLTKERLDKIANLNPRLLKVKAGKIKLNNVGSLIEREGNLLSVKRIKKSGLKFFYDKKTSVDKTPSKKSLTLTIGTVKTGAESLSQQLKRGGKKSVAVSARASSKPLGWLIRRKMIVRKQLPFDESLLSKKTKNLLKRFDKGRLTNKQVIRLNKRIRKESKKIGVMGQTKGVDLLERSLYFDPDKMLRASRLKIGEEVIAKEGTLLDLFRGRATIFSPKKAKPQILVIEELVDSLPKIKYFSSIRRKLARSKIAGKDPNLTKKELAKLSTWQVTPSGKLKPVGSTTWAGGMEREVTIAPNEVIKRVRKLGTVLIEKKIKRKGKVSIIKKRVPIIAIKILKDKRGIKVVKKIEKLKTDITKLNLQKSKLRKPSARMRIQRKINIKQTRIQKIKGRIANKKLKDFLRDSRRLNVSPKRVVSKTRLIRASSRLGQLRKLRGLKRGIYKRNKINRIKRKNIFQRKKVPSRIKRPIIPTPKRPVIPTPKRPVIPTPSRPSTPPSSPPPRLILKPFPPIRKRILPPIFSKGLIKRTKLKKSIRTFNVFGKSGKKFIKLNRVPLKKNDALSKGAFAVDNTTAKTFKIVPAGKSKLVGGLNKMERNYFNRAGYKLREQKIRRGRKFQLKNKYIEKRKFGIDTRGEKRGLTIAKYLGRGVATNQKKFKRIKTRISPARRKMLLLNLKKARRVLNRKMKRR